MFKYISHLEIHQEKFPEFSFGEATPEFKRINFAEIGNVSPQAEEDGRWRIENRHGQAATNVLDCGGKRSATPLLHARRPVIG
jgi:hypothetical protein